MASKKGGKGKKEKKPKGKVRKFNLDLFGILTFTRIYGVPFEGFIMGGGKEDGKKGAKKKPPPAKGKKGAKGKKVQEVAPKLQQFPPVAEDLVKDAKKMRRLVKFQDQPDVIIPTTDVGHKEKTTRPPKPFEEGGSISDVMCGKRYPLPPRPQPHGGVYGDMKCLMCKSTGGLMSNPYTKINKKLRKLLYTEFDKAKYIIEWLTERITNSFKKYEDHFEQIFEEMGPVLDALDESEWDDHFEVRGLIDKWRDLKKSLDVLRAELKQFRKNKEEEIAKAVAEKMREFEEVERQMLAMEKKIQESVESLKDWQEHADTKISGPEAEIAATIALLQKIRDSIFTERDTLRQLLGWEMSVATEDTVAVMEEVIRQDLDVILGWMHPAWFRLFLENRRMQEERGRLRMENHLLELEVETLSRQVSQMEGSQREVESTRTHFITPPNLNERVDKFTRRYYGPDDRDKILLQDYPTTKLIHE
ncbi:uncharacterized protein LOC110856027 [Folsomia candida]|uniref:uncharacterized protein LOC110856027 n=1 Tax=Folsomia candida TaxID=158441 RepID=UPI0016055145|nr:uncharacterized protein LOC110856027 [Folsomia candida]